MPESLSEEFLDAIYEPALHAGDWRSVLAHLRDLLGSAEIAFTLIETGSARPEIWETTGAILSQRERD